ncbi:hypothetical protein [Lactiplantibacillus plantarum]|uniref:hypothetical protein n=1 Tax=Lactiplantibacillus plantarum TaxID=1590 RepID=UPI0037543AA9
MSDEMKELRKRLNNAIIDSWNEGRFEDVKGIKIALYELEHLDKPYIGTDYSQGDGNDEK